MRRRGTAVLIAGLLTLTLAPSVMAAETFTTELSGENSVPPLDVEGTGEATVTISDDGQTVSWDVTYSGLTGAPGAGHIHVGAAGANGPVMIPFAEVTETGTSGEFAAADYETGDGLPADWDGVLAAIRDGNAYVNIHTEANPGGEIRGQLAGGGGGATTPPTDTLSPSSPASSSLPVALFLAVAVLASIGVGARFAVARHR
jgi:CHRD domain